MHFDDLQAQPPFDNPVSTAYAERVLSLSAAVLGTIRHERNIQYGEAERHKLDIYLPKNSALSELPVLIFWHGGRWRAGYKEYNGFMAPGIIDLPAILISPSYGLSPAYRFPVQLHDCLTALAWVYQNIGQYGGDKQNICLSGHSAGGHLAALSTLRSDLYARYGLPEGLIKACLPISGTMNFAFSKIKPGSEEEQVRRILLASPDQANDASPLHYVENAKNKRVPFLLTYGEHDFPRVLATNKDMHQALNAVSADVTALCLTDCNHFQAHIQAAAPENPWLNNAKALMLPTSAHAK